MLRHSIFAVLALMALAGCPGGGDGDGGTGGGGGSTGGGGGGGTSGYAISDLDPNATDLLYTAIAVDAAQKRVGVVYFTPSGSNMNEEDGGTTPNFDLKYVEWKDGAIVVPPEKIRTVQRLVGLDLVFNPSGAPVASYLGGDPGFEVGKSIFWFQSDAVINVRDGAGTWTETTVVAESTEIICGNTVSDIGFLVGLWPAMAYDSTGKLYLAYRDGHNGQFPQQDWAGSDVEVWDGSPVPTHGVCAATGGNVKKAYGGHIRMVMGKDDQPFMTYDQMFGDADVNGQNVLIQRYVTGSGWTQPSQLIPMGNTQHGASLAYDETEGYGIAVFSVSDGQLFYVRSADGVNWDTLQPIFSSGSGGWYPSLAMDPVNHEPAVAFYVCSAMNGVQETNCPTFGDELRVTQRIAGHWRENVIDTDGAYDPKLGFIIDGQRSRRVIVYRSPPAVDAQGHTVAHGKLKIAVEP